MKILPTTMMSTKQISLGKVSPNIKKPFLEPRNLSEKSEAFKIFFPLGFQYEWVELENKFIKPFLRKIFKKH